MAEFRMARQVDRVPSMVVPLDRDQELRFQRLLDSITLVDMHEHPMVLTDNVHELRAYFRSHQYQWAYDGVRHGGWTAVATANGLSCGGNASDGSFARFEDLLEEVALMQADLMRCTDVRRIARADDIVAARQAGAIGFLPTVEHLALGHELHHVEVLYGVGIRLAGLTYMRKTYVGDGQNERTDAGLSELGVEVIRRMNDIGMVVDLSHAGSRTALEAIDHSRVPVMFSHNAAHAIWPTVRTRSDADFLACAAKGGLVCVTAVPNSLSRDPHQDINCVLDHYDYLVNLVGVEHVGIGTDTLVGDHVGFHKLGAERRAASGLPTEFPAEYLSGLESPADGKNIIRGLIARGHSDAAIVKIAGQNAVDLLRRTIG
ncbi:MAG: membrane dipeptidase [Chloroflexi bacterium]|nr:membrane dipeptidase [Chloroflexota bacterium]